MADVKLRHKGIASHVEEWTITQGIVKVQGIYPQNHPSHSSHTLTKAEAIRQYVLMTSEVEGWEVEFTSKSWHDFIEEVEEEKETKTADQIISDISEVLGQWDGKDLERIANQILSHPIKYIGDSIFESE